MGSKNRISKFILPIILKDNLPNQCYVEPFVGGGNMIDKVTGNRIGSDINKYVIDALISIRDEVDNFPKTNKDFTEADYISLKKSDNYKYKGYAGFSFSYGGKWLGGWRRDREKKRDYINESYRNAKKQSKFLQDIVFINISYENLEIPKNSIIYCDPPYINTTTYKNKFNHDIFWQWCRNKSIEGHNVFISEYVAPIDFECIWEKEITSSLTKNTGSKKGVEKLFKYKY